MCHIVYFTSAEYLSDCVWFLLDVRKIFLFILPEVAVGHNMTYKELTFQKRRLLKNTATKIKHWHCFSLHKGKVAIFILRERFWQSSSFILKSSSWIERYKINLFKFTCIMSITPVNADEKCTELTGDEVT